MHDIHNPCRDRHCGSCGEHLARQWYDAHSGELLPLAHQHVVFTAAHELHVLLDVWENRRVIYPLYLRAARDALVRVAGEMLGIMPGQAAFLHTWNQWMLMHLHIHTIWPNGGWLIDQPDRFVTVDATQLNKARLINAPARCLVGPPLPGRGARPVGLQRPGGLPRQRWRNKGGRTFWIRTRGEIINCE